MKLSQAPFFAGKITSKMAMLGVFGIAAVGGIAIVSSNVFASLNATAYNTNAHAVDSGDLRISLTPSTAAGITAGVNDTVNSPIKNLVPGDIVNRYVDVTNTGTVAGKDMKLSLTDATPTLLTTDASRGLQITVNECSVVWSNDGTCSGTESTALSSTAASALSNKALTFASLASLAVTHLQISVNLPDQTELSTNNATAVPAIGTGSIQHLAAAITWHFDVTQRTSGTTNG